MKAEITLSYLSNKDAAGNFKMNSPESEARIALVRIYALILQAARERKARMAEASDHASDDEYPNRGLVQEPSINTQGQTMPQVDSTPDPEQIKENDIENSPQSLKL